MAPSAAWSPCWLIITTPSPCSELNGHETPFPYASAPRWRSRADGRNHAVSDGFLPNCAGASGRRRLFRCAVTVRVEHGDCLEVIPRLVAEGVVVDSIVTDPPYNLVSVARGQTPGSVAAAKDVFSRVKAGGFMGLGWDSTGIAFNAETWRIIGTILRPGGFLLAFGGTRTAHRMVCAIEDAGLVIQDTIAWLYGSGFPKRRDMLKPAMEMICVAYKPGGKRTLQVDECRSRHDD